MKLIAETAWHHEGDFDFMKSLVNSLANQTKADVIKLHLTLDLDEYMDSAHPAYAILKPWVFNESQWEELIGIVKSSGKELMLLLNDRSSVRFAKKFAPEYIEVHSVNLNDIFLLEEIKNTFVDETILVLGVGGTELTEVDAAMQYLGHLKTVLMFGFQNYPTVYQDVNLNKVRRIMGLYRNVEFGYADHTAWDSPVNELITLLGGAVGMSYIEKHVTLKYGEKRTDFSAAISVDMFNDLANKVNILKELNGTGSLSLNTGEQNYSVFGPMKKAAVLVQDLKNGDVFDASKIKFIRHPLKSDLSQTDVIRLFGKTVSKDIAVGTLVTRNLFD